MNWIKWHKLVGSAFFASALLLVLTASAWAQSSTAAPDVKIAEIEPAEPGVLIVRVSPDSPAAVAGLQRGDVVLAVGDTAVNQAAELAAAIMAAQVGDELALTVQHGDEEQTITVTVGERQGAPYLGITPYSFGPSRDNFRMWRTPAAPAMPDGQFAISQTVGVRIISVLPDSPAAAADLTEGDLIVAVEGEALKPGADLRDLIVAYKPGDQVTLQVQGSTPDAPEREVTVTLGEQPDAPERAYLGVQIAPLVVFQVEEHQGGTSGRRIQPGPEMRRFRFIQPHGRTLPPFLPMMPYGHWFGYPGYALPWCQPMPEEMFFSMPVPPPMIESAPEGFAAPEIDSFEFAQPYAPDQFGAPVPGELEEEIEL